MSTNWKAVAEALAGRLANHADCGTHRRRNPDPSCPFCRDRAAYDAYLAAGGQDFRYKPPDGTRSVPIHEVPPNRNLMLGGMTYDA
jgi:hypothetical protein